VILITNMTRKENSVENKEAGVESIKLFRKYREDDSIFLFIGWVEAALEKLAKNKIEINDKLQVSNKKAALVEFL